MPQPGKFKLMPFGERFGAGVRQSKTSIYEKYVDSAPAGCVRLVNLLTS